jgi:signal transduction histidine kinase
VRIRWRLAAYGGVVAAIAMFSFGLLLSLLARSSAPSDQEDRLEALATTTAENLRAGSLDELSSTAPLSTVDLSDDTSEFIAIYASNGTPLYSTGQLRGGVPTIPAAVVVETLSVGMSSLAYSLEPGLDLRIVAVPITIGGESAIVVAGQPTAFIEDQLAGIQAVVWIAALLTLIFAGIVSWLVSGRALRPLRALATTTDEIGATGDLSQRLPAVKSKDEVGTLTRSFNEMLDRVETAQNGLAESLAQQRRFVADASHELRSPLTTIRSNAGFLLDRTDADAEDREDAIADIDAEAERMARLVDDLLVLASADAGRPLEQRPIDMAAVVHDLGRRAARLSSEVSITAVEPVVVDGDPAALTRLAWILIDNADRHGGASVDVAVSSAADEAHLTVTDDGAGFPPDQVDRVFDRFHRADPARSPTGAGLGLAIARGIVTAHGGTIEASNQIEGGARVDVILPLRMPR